MKIAALSDIHGNLPALDAVLADIEKQGADIVVNLGDILSGPLYPSHGWDLEFRSVEYDWHAAADLAAANDRPDWESALRTGYC
jgi:Icc-related predicted phosphoesterase